jgi:hypothetical protein
VAGTELLQAQVELVVVELVDQLHLVVMELQTVEEQVAVQALQMLEELLLDQVERVVLE